MHNTDEELSISECRQLRELVTTLALPGALNRTEYLQIVMALKSCAERMEKEGRVID